jgi:hypothetical protein
MTRPLIFKKKLAFYLAENTDLGGGKRWVRVTPSPGEADILLARAIGAAQQTAIGNAAGGRVAFFPHTDDFAARHARILANGVHFCEKPRSEPYGQVAVFEDLYGNPWDLVGPGQF